MNVLPLATCTVPSTSKLASNRPRKCCTAIEKAAYPLLPKEPPTKKRKIELTVKCEEIELGIPCHWRKTPSDLTIMLDGWKIIRVHRDVLKKSDFFSGMLRHREIWLENTVANPIYLRGLNEAAVIALLTFFYTSEIDINPSNIYYIASLADAWLAEEVLEKCREYIQQRATLDESLQILKMRRLKLTVWAMGVIEANAVYLKDSLVFLSLSADLVCQILESPRLNVESECIPLDLLIAWGEANRPINATLSEFIHAQWIGEKKLIDTIEFSSIHPSNLTLKMMADKLLTSLELNTYRDIGIRRLNDLFPPYKYFDTIGYEKRYCKRQFNPLP